MAAGLRLASAGDDIKLWDCTGYTLVKKFNPHSNNVASLAWSHDNSVSFFNVSLNVQLCTHCFLLVDICMFVCVCNVKTLKCYLLATMGCFFGAFVYITLILQS